MQSDTDIKLRKEQEKIMAKRRINEERLNRLTSPEFRFGANKDYLKEQLAEKELLREQEKNEEALLFATQQQIKNMLDIAEMNG